MARSTRSCTALLAWLLVFALGSCDGENPGSATIATGPGRVGVEGGAGGGDAAAGRPVIDAGKDAEPTEVDLPSASVDAAPEIKDAAEPSGPDAVEPDHGVGPSPDPTAPPATAGDPDAAPAPPPMPDANVVPPAPDAFVGFSEPSQSFIDPFRLRLLPATPEVRVFYTLDGSTPTEQSPSYRPDSPILIDRALQVRVLAILGIARQIETRVYLQITDDLASFSSNLPLVFLHAFGAVEPEPDNYDFTPGGMLVARAATGATRPQSAVGVASRMGFKIRGRSSRNADQKSFGVEFWDTQDNKDLPLPVLGMPAQSDWVLYGPWSYDPSLLRNALFYALSNRIGRYAPRTRFVEIFVESEGRALSTNSYRGVYVLVEKIKRDPHRVNVAQLKATDLRPPAVTGGYIVKVDNNFSPDEVPLRAGGRTMELVDPNSTEIEPAQLAYLGRQIDEVVAALAGPGGRNPATNLHYSDYIDVDSWIDLHILNIFAKNADSLRLSAYYHKDRNGKIKAGPLWDLDRSSGAADGRVVSPEGWNVPNGTQVFTYPWWNELFQDPAFTDRYWKRWEELLATHLRSDVLTPMVRSMAAELSEAQRRHFERWPDYAPEDGYQAEISRLTRWLDARIEWVRTHLRTYSP